MSRANMFKQVLDHLYLAEEILRENGSQFTTDAAKTLLAAIEAYEEDFYHAAQEEHTDKELAAIRLTLNQ